MDIKSTSARLYNGIDDVTSVDGTAFTETADYPAGTTFYWCKEHARWETGEVTVSFSANGGTGSISPITMHTPGKLPELAETFTRQNLHLKGWNTNQAGSTGSVLDDNVFMEDGGIMALPKSATVYAQWAGNVTWVDGDGKTLRVDELDLNAVPAYGEDAAVPTKTTDAQYVYTFAGWSTEENGTPLSTFSKVTGDITYYAVFTGETRSYTVTWKDHDGTVLAKQENIPYGTNPEYPGEKEPYRNGEQTTDYSLGYVFTGWSPELKPVDGDVTYTAQYDEEKNYYVEFFNADGTYRYNKLGVPAGTDPADHADYKEPTPPSGGYSFAGWATAPNSSEALEELPACNSAAKYYAVFVKTGSALRGDVDGNNTVNAADLTELLINFGKTEVGIRGDVDGNNTVNAADLTELLINFGKTLS